MTIRCAHAVLPVSSEAAFAFLSRLENLPVWATEFIREDFRAQGTVATARTAHGNASIRRRTDRETGVIDFLVAFTGQASVVFPSRVLPLPGGKSVYVFIAIQGPDQPLEAFDADVAALERELAALPQLLETSHAVVD